MNGSNDDLLLIQFNRLDRQYLSIKDEIDSATQEVLASGQCLSGIYTSTFEHEIAERCQRKYAITVGNATMGLYMTLMILKSTIKQSTIGIPNMSFSATLNSIYAAECIPRIFDVARNGQLDLDLFDPIENKIDILMYVNLYGDMIDYNQLKLKTEFFNTNKIYLIEDAAQSLGASYHGKPSGSFGDASVLSFDPTKNLPNFGSGGMVLTDDKQLAKSVNMFKNNNAGLGGINLNVPALNSKMSEVDCATMSVKLKYFDSWQKRRHEIAEYYLDNLTNVELPTINEHVIPSWHKFVIHHTRRNDLAGYLQAHGISTKIHYNKPLVINFGSQAMDNCSTTLSLPIYPEMTDNEVEYVVKYVNLYS